MYGRDETATTILGAMRLTFVVAAAGILLASCSSSTSQSPASSPTSSAAANLPVPDASCAAESTSHSLNSNTPTSFTLVNHTSETLSLFWLNFQGQRVHYTDIDPSGAKDQGTFVTHPWVVADPNGQCLNLFLVTTQTTITIG